MNFELLSWLITVERAVLIWFNLDWMVFGVLNIFGKKLMQVLVKRKAWFSISLDFVHNWWRKLPWIIIRNWWKYDVYDVDLCYRLTIEVKTKGKVNLAWERNILSSLSFDHVMFDHWFKWGNFCELLDFNEFWSVLKCKKMI